MIFDIFLVNSTNCCFTCSNAVIIASLFFLFLKQISFHKHGVLRFHFGEHAVVGNSPQWAGYKPAVMLSLAQVCLAFATDMLVAEVNFTLPPFAVHAKKCGRIKNSMHLRKMSADWILIGSCGTPWVILVLGST